MNIHADEGKNKINYIPDIPQYSFVLIPLRLKFDYLSWTK